MTAIQIANALRYFGADVLLLALGVTFVTSFLKKTVLKSASAKLYVFLPFVIGIVIYAVYRMIATWSFAPLLGELRVTAEKGFGCGSAATLYYAVYEQFFRREVSPVYPLLEGLVPEKERMKAADELYAARLEEDFPARAAEILLTRGATLTEEELHAAAELIAEFLSAL